jgi:hypothetical protein
MAFLIAIGVAGALGATSGPLHRRGGAPLIYLTGAIAAAVLAAASLVLRVEPAEREQSPPPWPRVTARARSEAQPFQ